MKISDLTIKNLVNVNLKSHTKEAVFSEILDILDFNKKIKNKEEILGKLLEREKISSTYIGNGVSIPHTRIEGLEQTVFFVGISKHGINFSDNQSSQSNDKLANIIILFLTPLGDTSTHLKIISKLAAVCKDTVLLNRILESHSNEKLFKLLKQIDTEKQGFFALTKEGIYTELETNDNGISEQEAKKRLQDYGENELKALRKKSVFVRFGAHLVNFLALLMWGAALLSFLSGTAVVGWVIIMVVFLNAIFAFFQEFKAEKAIESLKNLFPSYTRVIRDGKEQKILASQIVPGDIVIFEEGDNIPADARLIETYELRVNNSAFSGESRATYKMSSGFQDDKDFLWLEMPNLVFAGTNVVNGFGKAVVIATGMSTEIGKIAYLTQTVKEELSPLQKEINKVIKIISLISIVMGLVFFIVGLLWTQLSFFGVLIFVIGIILSNVPQGLMPTVTLSLSMAVQKMAKKKALIKKLSSVETLGCTNVICTDKTGTLTTNQMCIKKIWLNNKIIEITGSGYEPKGDFIFEGKKTSPENFKADNLELLVLSGVLCNTAKLVSPSNEQNFWSIIGDPTEASILTLSKKIKMNYEEERDKNGLEKRFPFESVRKRMSSVHRLQNGKFSAFVKGAPKEILEICNKIVLGKDVINLTPEKKAEILLEIDKFANEGLRVLGFTYRDIDNIKAAENAEAVEKDLIFIGVMAMYDPPRDEVKDAVGLCKKAGIRVVMITGDYQITALSIARQVGIISTDDAEVITGIDLTAMPEETLKQKLATKEVIFARVNPEHKLRVVQAFQELGNIVAVTGDGVNDAPALKKADIGIAMGLRGTDVAKQAAEMILLDDNFSSIVSAIEEGRTVFLNIKKFITYIFAHLVPEALPFVAYVVLKIPVPISVLQILAIDLGTEIIPALGLGIEKPEPGIMEASPRQKTSGIMTKLLLFRGYLFLGMLNSIAVLAAYFITLYNGGWRLGITLEPNDSAFQNTLHLKAMTMVFAGIVVMQIANAFSCRSERHSAFKIGFFKNKLILWGIAFELVFISAIIYIPFLQKIFNTTGLNWKDWALLFGMMIVIFFAEELRKAVWAKPVKNNV